MTRNICRISIPCRCPFTFLPPAQAGTDAHRPHPIGLLWWVNENGNETRKEKNLPVAQETPASPGSVYSPVVVCGPSPQGPQRC